MTVQFRNVDASPSDRVETWPYEALVTAIERGLIGEWARVTAAIHRDPWGDVARAVEDYLVTAPRSGVGALLGRALDRSRRDAEAMDRAVVAERVREYVARSGLTAAQFASRVGTSASRLSTYARGRVVPSASMLVRMERTAALGPPTARDADSP